MACSECAKARARAVAAAKASAAAKAAGKKPNSDYANAVAKSTRK